MSAVEEISKSIRTFKLCIIAKNSPEIVKKWYTMGFLSDSEICIISEGEPEWRK